MKPINNVVIVGGGTAGWMSASYLRKALGPHVTIRLIESGTIGTVGVGEGTFSTIHLFFEFLGLSEADWMPHCNAGYKLAIRFVGWNSQNRDFYHPFQTFELVQGVSIIEWWLKLKRHTSRPDYSCFTVPAICDAKRSPNYLDGRSFDSKVDGQIGPNLAGTKPVFMDDLEIQYPYAYHFDAGLLTKFLAGYAQQRGVERICDDVVDTTLDEQGYIRSVQTKQHGPIEGDLFIDCTGFRGLLINKVLNEPFTSFVDQLPCDSAVAMQVPYEIGNDGMAPYTTATALNAGWVWNIPLFSRIGSGYVYSSAFISKDEAEREFRAHLGPGAEGRNALHINMRVGRNRNSWVRNCVAIGLSSGFVEPLESTGMFFIHNSVEQLVTHFPDTHIDEHVVRSYNRSVGDCIDGVREFLILHYVASNRADTKFWQATKHDLAVPPELRERLALWGKQLPTKRSIDQNFHGFSPYSYAVMLLGLGSVPERSLPALDGLDDGPALAAFEQIERQ